MPVNNITTETVRTLWHNWAVAFGSPALVTLASTLVPPIWLPLLCMLIAYMLLITHRKRTAAAGIDQTGCSLVIWLTMIAMAVGTVIMIAINIIYSPKIIPTVVADNPAVPYITSMVLYPLMCAASLYGLIMEQDNKCCRRCQATHGYYNGNSSVALFYSRESRYQLRMCLALSAVVSVTAVVYYFNCYINVNLNSPDRFFFVGLPVIVYLLSLGYMAIRYFRLYYAVINNRHGHRHAHSQFTIVRFLVLSGDYLLLTEGENGDWDSPLIDIINHESGPLSDSRAHRLAEPALKGHEYTLRFLYENGAYANGANVLHYAVVLPADTDALPDAMRCNIDDIQRLLRADKLSPYITNELYRIRVITMAWKTYDRSGHRLYPIRNYQPTFRLRDFNKWTVDYNDIGWMQVAKNNEDKPLYRLRRFVNRYLLFQKTQN